MGFADDEKKPADSHASKIFLDISSETNGLIADAYSTLRPLDPRYPKVSHDSLSKIITLMCGRGRGGRINQEPKGFTSPDLLMKYVGPVLGALAFDRHDVRNQEEVMYSTIYPVPNEALVVGLNNLKKHPATPEVRLAAIKDIEAACNKVGITIIYDPDIAKPGQPDFK